MASPEVEPKKLDLAAIKERYEKAKPEPWLTPKEDAESEPDGRFDRVPVDHEGCDVWPWDTEEDMVFAYKARTDIPDLVAEVERLQNAGWDALNYFRRMAKRRDLTLLEKKIRTHLESVLQSKGSDE